MAISPTTASSFSPYCSSDCRIVWASTQVKTETSRPASAPTNTGPPQPRAQADHRRGDRGEDQHAFQPLAEDDDRAVGDDRRLVGGVAERRGGVAELLVQRDPRLADLAPRRALGDQLGEAVLPTGAEPDQALDVEREPLVEAAQPPLGAELEERVGLQPRLLGLAVLAGADRGLHAVERERDQVVVGLVGLLRPRLRHRGGERVLRLGRRSLRPARGGRRPSLLLVARTRRCLPSSSSAAAPASVRAPVALGELVAQVRRSAPTAPVRKATASWISKSRVTCVSLTPRPYSTGHEREELQQLLGAARGLLGRERRGGEAFEPARLVERGVEIVGLGRRVEGLRSRAAPRPRPRSSA